MGNYNGYRYFVKLKPDTPNEVISKLEEVLLSREINVDSWTRLFGFGSSYFEFSYPEYEDLFDRNSAKRDEAVDECYSNLFFIEASGLSHWVFLSHGSKKEIEDMSVFVDLIKPHILNSDQIHVVRMTQYEPYVLDIEDKSKASLDVEYLLNGEIHKVRIKQNIETISLPDVLKLIQEKIHE